MTTTGQWISKRCVRPPLTLCDWKLATRLPACPYTDQLAATHSGIDLVSPCVSWNPDPSPDSCPSSCFWSHWEASVTKHSVCCCLATGSCPICRRLRGWSSLHVNGANNKVQAVILHLALQTAAETFPWGAGEETSQWFLTSCLK